MAYYLIDFENVKNIQGITTLSYNDTVIFFYSKNSNALSFALHREIASSAAEFRYFEIESGGKNALDFQLSSYLGFLIANFPEEHFYIVSKDTGFATVISFWKENEDFNFNVERIENIICAESVDKSSQNVKSESKHNSTLSLPDELKRKNSDLRLKEGDMKKIVEFVNQYKTKQAINNNLMKYFKDSGKVGKITKVIRPFLKDKK